MLYDVRQTTTYTYGTRVRAARQVLRLTLVDRASHQHVIAQTLTTRPEPTEIEQGLDFFGNALSWVAFDVPHDRLDISTRCRIAVHPAPLPDPARTAPVEAVRRQAFASTDLGPRSPVHGLYPSRLVPLDALITDWVGQSCVDGRPMLEAALEVMHRVHEDFAYTPGATDVTTLPSEAFTARRGVCQDFAHVMICGLRGLGLPVRYVSGYLRTVPPHGQERLAGADATHAWVEVWCGDEVGWIGLDPTNAMPAGADHIVLAVGRDYADVAPVDGVIVTSGDHGLDVRVDVIPLEDTQVLPTAV